MAVVAAPKDAVRVLFASGVTALDSDMEGVTMLDGDMEGVTALDDDMGGVGVTEDEEVTASTGVMLGANGVEVAATSYRLGEGTTVEFGLGDGRPLGYESANISS